ncbi:hypothetical protein [Paenibacillus koleovorans]|uniref:hypothetical protein n=1 Tax=Paenibacillus koleovorans TaxID=121608 RepID=UPI000FD89622|nr:hypothetical protein [Paenibacillus koleovorans]
MRVFGWFLIVALLSVLLGCEQAADKGSLVNPEVTAAATVGTDVSPENKIPPVETVLPSPIPLSFRTKLETLSIGEENDQLSRAIRIWNRRDLPTEPLKLVHRLEHVSIHLTFSNPAEQAEIKELLDRVTIDGQKPAIDPYQPARGHYRIDLNRQPDTSFVVRIGDLPPLTIAHMSPVTYKLVNDSVPSASDSLLFPAAEYGNQLYIPLEQEAVTLEFSEAMVRSSLLYADSGATAAPAQWLDDKHLRVELQNHGALTGKGVEIRLRTNQLSAVSGNEPEGFLAISRMPAISWRDGQSGQEVSKGPRDRYYDQLLFAPDKKRYIGILALGGSMSGDGDGMSYAFVLEQPGKPPVLVEKVFYSTIEPYEAPVQWLDDKRLFYASYYGAYVYDTENGSRQALYEDPDKGLHGLNFALWDPHRKQTNAVIYRNARESWLTRAVTFGWSGEVLTEQEDFSETVEARKYSLLDLAIHPTADGVYWTRTEQGIPVTDYVDNKGDRQTVDGIVRLATAEGAYLQRYELSKEYKTPLPVSWHYWQPGQPVQPINAPPEQSIVFVSGERLIAQRDEAYYEYEADGNRWVLWQPAGGEDRAEPVRGPDGLYRVVKQ